MPVDAAAGTAAASPLSLALPPGSPETVVNALRSVNLRKVDFVLAKSPHVQGLFADIVGSASVSPARDDTTAAANVGTPFMRSTITSPSSDSTMRPPKKNLTPLIAVLHAERAKPLRVQTQVATRKVDTVPCKRRVFENHQGTKDPSFYSRKKGEVRKRTEKGWMIGKQLEIDGHSVFLPREKKNGEEKQDVNDLTPLVPPEWLAALLQINTDTLSYNKCTEDQDDHKFHMFDLELSVQSEFHAEYPRDTDSPGGSARALYLQPKSLSSRAMGRPPLNTVMSGLSAASLPRDTSLASMLGGQQSPPPQSAASMSSIPMDDLDIDAVSAHSDAESEEDIAAFADIRAAETEARQVLTTAERDERICINVTRERDRYLSLVYYAQHQTKPRW